MAYRERPEQKRADGGFTLIELLIVVAIIGIIAAIAIPSFLKMKVRAKTAVIASDFHAIREAAMQYNMDNNVFPPDANPGVYPPTFKDYLTESFKFTGSDPTYTYDWENWSGADGNPGDGGTGIEIGFTVHTSDRVLGATLLKRAPEVVKQTQPTAYTWVIQPVTGGG